MKVVVDELGVCEKRVSVTLEAGEVQERYDALVQYYQKNVQVPGFRKGKAPAALVAKRYGGAVLKEAQEMLESAGWREFFRQNPKMKIVAEKGDIRREPASPELGKEYAISLDVITAPEITLPEFKGLEVEARKVTVEDKEVEDAIDTLRERASEFKDAPEGSAAKEGDLVGIAYEASLDGKPLAEALPAAERMAKSDDYWAVASAEYEFVPGMGPALVDMKIGDEKDVNVTFGSSNVPVAGLEDKTVLYHVKVNKIRTRMPAELNEDFFKRFHVETEKEFRKAIEGRLQVEKNMAEWERRQAEAITKLMEKVGTVDCAEYEIEREANRRLYGAVMARARANVPEDQIKADRDKMAAECREEARTALARQYVLEAIADKLSITVSDAEINHAVEQDAQQRGMSAEQLAKQLNASVKNLQDVARDNLLREKAIHYLLKHARWTGDDAEAAASVASKFGSDADADDADDTASEQAAAAAAEAAEAAAEPAQGEG